MYSFHLELAFFFPNFTPPRAVVPAGVRAQMEADMGDDDDVFPPKTPTERTITIIRPEALKVINFRTFDMFPINVMSMCVYVYIN